MAFAMFPPIVAMFRIWNVPKRRHDAAEDSSGEPGHERGARDRLDRRRRPDGEVVAFVADRVEIETRDVQDCLVGAVDEKEVGSPGEKMHSLAARLSRKRTASSIDSALT